jgi:hypothetical protein
MSILKSLGASYRFTEADVDRAMHTQFDHYENNALPEPTAEELELSELALTAYSIWVKLHRWPTVAEVVEYQQREEEEYAKRKAGTNAKQ